MKILESNQEFITAIRKLASGRPKCFYLASYKLRVDKQFEAILKSLPKNCDVRIFVGVDQGITKKQLSFYKSFFADFNIKVVKNSHVKLVLTDTATIIGGRNYTGSDWDDFSFIFYSKEVITKTKASFLKLFNKRKSILR